MGSTDDVVGLVSIGQLAKAAGVSSRTVLRKLRDCVHDPAAGTGPLDLRTLGEAQPALCSL